LLNKEDLSTKLAARRAISRIILIVLKNLVLKV
jgi:hypothetical protein